MKRVRIALVNPPEKSIGFQSCEDCIHADDEEIHCIIRKCVHAIQFLYDCYEKRGDEND